MLYYLITTNMEYLQLPVTHIFGRRIGKQPQDVFDPL